MRRLPTAPNDSENMSMQKTMNAWPRTTAAIALALAILIAAPVTYAQEGEPTDAATTLGEEEIEAIVRAYLLEHPEIVVEALQAFEAKRAAEEEQRAAEAIGTLIDQLNDNPLSPVGGNPDGDVTIVEFYDYNCPYCKREAAEITKLLAEDGDIRLVYKEWPILSPDSEIAARVALAAWHQDEDAYLRLHNAMMAHRGKLDKPTIMAYAEAEGLNMAQLQQDMASAPVEAEIQHVRQLAEQIGLTGTPAYIVDGQLVPGAVGIEELRKLVAAARAT
jgi:protein-disulfide isomerase